MSPGSIGDTSKAISDLKKSHETFHHSSPSPYGLELYKVARDVRRWRDIWKAKDLADCLENFSREWRNVDTLLEMHASLRQSTAVNPKLLIERLVVERNLIRPCVVERLARSSLLAALRVGAPDVNEVPLFDPTQIDFKKLEKIIVHANRVAPEIVGSSEKHASEFAELLRLSTDVMELRRIMSSGVVDDGLVSRAEKSLTVWSNKSFVPITTLQELQQNFYCVLNMRAKVVLQNGPKVEM